MNHLSTKLCHVMKSRFYTTTINDQLSGWTKKKLQSSSQSQTCTKKGHGHWLVVACLSDPLSFLNPGKTITSEKYAQQIDEMHWKRQHLPPTLGNRKGPIFPHDNAWPPIITPLTLQKLNELGYKVLPHLPYSPDLSPTDYHFFKHLYNFLQGKCFHNQQKAENAFLRVCWIPKNGFLRYRNKQTCFSLAKMWL